MGEERDAGRSAKIASFGVSFGDEAPVEQDEKTPFRIAVIAELLPRPEWSTGRPAPGDAIAIDAESFDRVFADLAPSLAIDVDDPFSREEKPLRVDLVWRDRKAMRPSAIVAQVPVLRALVEARRVVQDVAARKRTADDARAHLERILPRRAWVDALLGDVRTSVPPVEGRPEKKREPTSALDALFDLVDMPSGPASAAAPAPRVSPSADATATQRLDDAFQSLLASILRHREVRRLEAAWRGLRLLVEHCDRRAGVSVEVLCAGRDDVTDALGRLASPGGAAGPIDLVVVDQSIEPTAADLERVEAWAARGGELLAPILVGGHPSMLGVASLLQVAQSTSALSTSGDPRAVVTRATASRDETRWIVVALNDPLVRAPHTVSTSRQEEPPFAEDADDEGAHVYASASYVVAALCARSHARTGWPTSITGSRDGALGDLPVRTTRDRGVEAAIPLQVAPSEGALRDAARAGITVLACAPNTDAAVLTRVPTLHRPDGGMGAAASTLPDQLFVSRFARAVHGIAGAIPATTEPRKAEEVARIALAEMFVNAAPPGPDLIARVDAAQHSLSVTVHPRRFAGVGLEELTVFAPLG
jgi:type VI secretion system ImpB/VipA family protein